MSRYRSTRLFWLLLPILGGLALALPVFTVEHAGFRVAARVMESIVTITPPPETLTDTPTPEETATPTDTPTPVDETPTHNPPSPPTPSHTPQPTNTANPPPAAPTPTRTPGLSQTATQTATPSPTSANLDFPSDESTPDASGSPAPATGSAGKLRFIVRAGRPTLSNGSRTQIIYACVFDTLPTMMKRSAPPTTTVTPTVDPALDRRAVVARDIQIKIDVPSAARISRGWSGPSQAEIYGRTARFYAPVLRDSETLAYAVQIEAGAATSLAWEVYVRDRRGPAVDVSAEVASGCDLAGLSLSPAGSSKSHQNPTPHSTADILVEISAVRFEDRETRAAADPKQHSLNYAGDSTQLVILIAAGVLSLISLTLAIALYRRQHSEPAEERPSVLGSRR